MALFTTHYTEVVGISTVTILFRYTVKKTRMRIYKYFFPIYLFFIINIIIIIRIIIVVVALVACPDQK